MMGREEYLTDQGLREGKREGWVRLNAPTRIKTVSGLVE